MLLHVLKYDLKNLVAERSLYVVASLFSALLLYGAWNGAAWITHQQATISAVQKEQASRLAALPGRVASAETAGLPAFLDPRMPAVVGSREGTPYLVLPPQRLGSLAIGQSDLYPYYIRASTQAASNVMSADEIENPDNLLYGRFDLAFVLVYLFPLLILALSYNILSSEREQGTLALTLSQPVQLATVVFGKLASRGAVLLLLAVSVSLLAAQASGGSFWSIHFLLWTVLLLAYAAFWFALAIVVNAMGKSSAANAVMVCVGWVVLVLVVPSALHLLAGALYPVPSRVEMIHAMREASKEATARGATLLARYLEDHPELGGGGAASVADAASKALAVQQETDRLIAPVLERFDRQLAGQRELLDRFRFLSPAILTQGAMADLAGSGTARFEHFRLQANRFLSGWRAHFARLVFAKKMITAGDIAYLPQFSWEEEASSAVVARVSVALLGIAIPALFLALAGIRMIRNFRLAG
jgi:ABC-2 type transport system permease protein